MIGLLVNGLNRFKMKIDCILYYQHICQSSEALERFIPTRCNMLITELRSMSQTAPKYPIAPAKTTMISWLNGALFWVKYNAGMAKMVITAPQINPVNSLNTSRISIFNTRDAM